MADLIVPREHQREIDDIACEPRDTSQLSEPLADSMLEYSLQRLKDVGQFDPTSPQDAQKAMFQEQLETLADGGPSASHTALITPATATNNASLGTQFANGYNFVNSQALGMSGQPYAVHPTMASNGADMDFDWWQYNLNDFQESTFSYEAMFGRDTIL